MNKRIEELAEQAGIEFDDSFTLEPEPIYYLKLSDFEKFAELIVQECIDIISPYTIRMGRPGEEYLHPIQEIRKHFGVK